MPWQTAEYVGLPLNTDEEWQPHRTTALWENYNLCSGQREEQEEQFSRVNPLQFILHGKEWLIESGLGCISLICAENPF